MSGLIRNFLTLIRALLDRGTFNTRSQTVSHFWVTPFDCGTRLLKSDKYLQFAESAQLDFLVKTKLLGKLVRDGIGFVNIAQLLKFAKPIQMFANVRAETAISYADERHVYFSHYLFVEGKLCGEILVKMKFKRGSITVRPVEIDGECLLVKPRHIDLWDQTLEAARED